MELKRRAKYEGLKIARDLKGNKTPSMYVIEHLLWEMFLNDQSIQNRILKRG